MRTAQDMYDFAISKGYGTKGLGNNLNHFSIIEKHLEPNEIVKFCFIGLRIDKDGQGGAGQWAFAITDMRLIQGRKNLIGESFNILNLNHLDNITKKTGILNGRISFSTVTETFFVEMPNKMIEATFEEINEVIGKFKNNSSSTIIQTSEADELLKFKKLLDEGIISQEEFNAKKKQLLGL